MKFTSVCGLSFILGIITLISIWIPILSNHYVSKSNVSNKIVLDSRQFPGKSVLKEISNYSISLPIVKIPDHSLIYQADNLLEGIITLPDAPVKKIHMPFHPDDLQQGHSAWQLSFSSLNVVYILTLAYEKTNNLKYLVTAKDYLIAWYTFERSAFLPIGFLWNDHAIASRINVIIRFWKNYRDTSSFSNSDARQILELVLLSAKHLAKKEQFTFATNHGVMQNLSLMKIGIAFPFLPEAIKLSNLGLERLLFQFKFFINDEGVVLEHSAEYHLFGYQLFGEALRYMTLMHYPIPNELITKYKLAGQFSQLLCQSDSMTLPRIGDTSSKKLCNDVYLGHISNGEMPPLIYSDIRFEPTSTTKLFPAAGYAIAWLNDYTNKFITQSVMNWSYHKGHGHKHADDLSINLWANNTRWLTSVGYYPYIYKGRLNEISWKGSNAPHFKNESSKVNRINTVNGSVITKDITFLDVVRKNTNNSAFERQLLQLNTNWLILDSFINPNKQPVEINWITDLKTSILQNSKDSRLFILSQPNNASKLSMYFLSNSFQVPNITYKENVVESNGTPSPTESLKWELPYTTKWSIMVASLTHKTNNNLPNVKLISWENSKKWQLELTLDNKSYMIKRNFSELLINNTSLKINTFENPGEALIKTQKSFKEAQRKYQISSQKDYLIYREKTSKVILLLLIIQMVSLLILRQKRICYFYSIAWVMTGLWLHLLYFSSST